MVPSRLTIVFVVVLFAFAVYVRAPYIVKIRRGCLPLISGRWAAVNGSKCRLVPCTLRQGRLNVTAVVVIESHIPTRYHTNLEPAAGMAQRTQTPVSAVTLLLLLCSNWVQSSISDGTIRLGRSLNTCPYLKLLSRMHRRSLPRVQASYATV